MNIGKNHHLTYCTNIHPGESWSEVFANLKKFIPSIKQEVAPDKAFGIGLRISDVASRELMKGDELKKFKAWLEEFNLYVFTLNGFPYGGFHGQKVKDEVHKPDWLSIERLDYTKRLCYILSELLPAEMEGSISTSPISYKPWILQEETKTEHVFSSGSQNIIQAIHYLNELYHTKGKLIHLDLEPEPDGLIENTTEFISFYKHWLLPASKEVQWKDTLNRHFRICYDVCHFAIEYEKPEEVFALLEKEELRIGKIQLSAALKIDLSQNKVEIAKELSSFVESTYLHQVIEQHPDGSLVHYSDLPQALEKLTSTNAKEWRTHFHVPLFVNQYKTLQSTQHDIVEVLRLILEKDLCSHLEIETYTWEVLPEDLKLDLQNSIVREIQWVVDSYQKNIYSIQAVTFSHHA
jgi:hypothetical protein